MWIYAQHYNDTGGALINGNVVDLAQENYGTDDNFSKKVVALWVYQSQ